MKIESRRGEVKTERIDTITSTSEKKKFEEFINLYRNLLMNVSVSIKTLEELTDKKREKENKIFFSYCPSFINATFYNFWAQSVIGLHEFFRGRDYAVRNFINYAKANWKQIFTGKWKETTTWSDGEVEERIKDFKYIEVEERLARAEKLLNSNKQIIEKIKTYREKVFAHIDKDTPKEKLKLEELRRMFSVAEELFNIVSSMYDNVHKCLEPTNSDDVHALVSGVNTCEEFKKEIRELRHKKIEKEIEEYFSKEK